jgi:teichuronic acid biosynthesis glycosyltransferase TuaC
LTSSRLRVLSFTTLFPNPSEPLRGMFVRNRLAAVARLVDLTVIAPVNAGRNARAWTIPTRRTDPEGFPVLHPRYLVLPDLFKEWDGAILHAESAAQVRGTLRQGEFDLVDGQYAFPDGEAAGRLATGMRRPLVLTVRGSDLEVLTQDSRRRPRIVALLRRAEAVIAVSRSLQRKAVALGAPPERLRVIQNGIDTRSFRPEDRVAARRRLGLPEDVRLVLAVGRLDPIKGLDLLVAAVAALRGRGRNDVACRILGEGPARSELERAIATSGLQRTIALPGSIAPEAIGAWYAAADCVCLLSHSEGCPNVVLEALACGRPVVATEVGGIPDLVREGETGMFVRRRDPAHVAEVLAAALDRTWSPEAIAATMAGRDWDAVAQEQLAVYREVIG